MDNAARQTVGRDDARYFAQTGHSVGPEFARFFDHYGPTICGFPITDVVIENGVKTQYFENLALEERAPGDVRMKRLGEAALAAMHRAARETARAAVARPEVVDLADSLPRHGSRTYPQRTLSDIRYLVLHHSGASGAVGPRAIAEEHVTANDWPGIGYHFVVDTAGTIYRTQDMTVVSHHARQFNPVAVGVALLGDLSSDVPTAEQLAAASQLLASLLADLGLPLDAVRGHREIVRTPCPGETFQSVWRPRLMQAIAELLGEAVPAPESGAAKLGASSAAPAARSGDLGLAGAAAAARRSEVTGQDWAGPEELGPDGVSRAWGPPREPADAPPSHSSMSVRSRNATALVAEPRDQASDAEPDEDATHHRD
ncbi:MAG: N-acetylmuramoyl-L-alanine amidase [Anaerolineae bacterium]|jgi:hypothetical protein